MEKDLSHKLKSNIAIASVIAILLGAIIYVPAVHLSKTEKEIVYRNFPVFVPVYYYIQDKNQEEGIQEEGEDNPSESSSAVFTKTLKIGDTDEEVSVLQRYLNSRGFIVAFSGPGSLGSETNLFGKGTQNALLDFQNKNIEYLKDINSGYNPTGFLDETTLIFINR
jgi:hypothetical protein